TWSDGRSLVHVVHGGRRPVRRKFSVFVVESVAILGKLPSRSEQHAAVFLAHDFPAARPLIGDGQHGPENTGLKCTVDRDPFGDTTKVELILFAAKVPQLHLVDEFALGWVQLPITDERVG